MTSSSPVGDGVVPTLRVLDRDRVPSELDSVSACTSKLNELASLSVKYCRVRQQHDYPSHDRVMQGMTMHAHNVEKDCLDGISSLNKTTSMST